MGKRVQKIMQLFVVGLCDGGHLVLGREIGRAGTPLSEEGQAEKPSGMPTWWLIL